MSKITWPFLIALPLAAIAASVLFPSIPALARAIDPGTQCQHLVMWLSPQEKTTIENEISSGQGNTEKINQIWNKSSARYKACIDQATAQMKIQSEIQGEVFINSIQ